MVGAAGATILGLAAAAVAVFATARDLDSARRALLRCEEKSRQAADVERIVVDLVMGERAFAAAGDDALLAPYERASAEAEPAIDALAKALADEPEQAARAERIRTLLARWMSETAAPVIAAKKASVAAAQGGASAPALRAEDLVLQQAGNYKVDELRRELDRVKDAEMKAGAALRSVADDAAARASVVALGGGAIAIAVAALSAWLLARSVTRPLADLLAAIGRIEAGRFDERVPVRGRDEVGLLAEAFNAMAESVAASRNEVEERARTLQAVLDHVDVGIALLDRAGKVVLMNDRLPKILAAAPAELEAAGGLLPWLLARAAKPEQVRSWQEQIAQNPSCVIFETVEIGPPRSLVIRVYGGPVPSGGAGEGARAAARAGARILVLRDATREADADREKTEFISTVSHELRTPLTSVRGYVDLVLAGDAGPISGQQREFLEIVSRNTERLAFLINDLLDVEKLEAGKLVLRRAPVDLAAVLESVVKTFDVTAQAKGLALESAIDALPAVMGDADRLTQVFANLVSNAIKYTREGTVLVRGLEVQDEIRIEVRDTGIGLTDEERGRIFEKFFRADNGYTRSVGGTGLGLAIAKVIVERHGARIDVASEPGKGSAFTVVFPVTRAAPAPAPQAVEAAGRSRR
jgi:signal transduction histidine kinase